MTCSKCGLPITFIEADPNTTSLQHTICPSPERASVEQTKQEIAEKFAGELFSLSKEQYFTVKDLIEQALTEYSATLETRVQSLELEIQLHLKARTEMAEDYDKLQLRAEKAERISLRSGCLLADKEKAEAACAVKDGALKKWARTDNGCCRECAAGHLYVDSVTRINHTENCSIGKAVASACGQPLLDELKELRKLLAVAKCPNCDGSGSKSVPLGERFVSHEMAMDACEPSMEGASMGIEWGQEQCQWCDERNRLAIDAAKENKQ